MSENVGFQTGFFVCEASATTAAQLFFFGTFAPFSRALLRPIAMACFLLVTFLPLLLLSSPFFRSFIAFSTSFPAFSPYFGIYPPCSVLRIRKKAAHYNKFSTSLKFAFQFLVRRH